MQGYKLTIEQSELLKGQLFAPNSYFNPVKGKNNEYFIFNEVEKCINEEFNWVKDLELVEYWSDIFTPPTLTPYAVVIPEIYQWAFPQDKFILGGFEIPLDTHNQDKVVNIAYFMWTEFRAELDSGKYEDLKRALMPLWDYVELQVSNQNLIVLW